LGVLKCVEPGLELDQRFYNIYFKIFEPKTRVLSKNIYGRTGPRGSLEILLKTKNQPKHKITNEGCCVCI